MHCMGIHLFVQICEQAKGHLSVDFLYNIFCHHVPAIHHAMSEEVSSLVLETPPSSELFIECPLVVMCVYSL